MTVDQTGTANIVAAGYDRSGVVPNTSTCAPWATFDDVQLTDPTLLNPQILFDCLQAASDILFSLSGSQFPGPCQDTVRPSARMVNRDHGRPIGQAWPYVGWGDGFGYWSGGYSGSGPGYSRWGWCTCNQEEDPAGFMIPSIDLGVFPLTSIVEVMQNGVVLDPSTYEIQDNRHLVRLSDPTTQPPYRINPGWPCFPAGTLVTTESGQKPIETVQAGERVLTHQGRWQTVLRSGQTGESETVTVAGRGGKVRCTPDHQFWAAEIGSREVIGKRFINPGHRGGIRSVMGRKKLGAPEWVDAQNLVGNIWATPRSIEPMPVPLPDITIPDNFWWIIGRWLGDGWTAGGRAKPPNPTHAVCPECGWKPTSGRADVAQGVAIHRGKMHRSQPRKQNTNAGIAICAGYGEADDLQRELEATGWGWRRKDERTSAQFKMSNPALWSWLREHFGVGSGGKQIPSWMLGAPEDVRRALLAGYVSADGWQKPSVPGRQLSFSVITVSKALGVSLKMLVASLNYAPAMYMGHPNGSAVIEGRQVKIRPTYRVDWNEVPPDGLRSQAWADDLHVWGRVKRVVLDERVVPVYDLEVEEDHSFVADGFVVHNCHQRVDVPATAPAVGATPIAWSVKFTYGLPPPPAGRRAAAELGYQLYLSTNAATIGECRLPRRVTQITRQGVTAMVLDPMSFLDRGHTGLYMCDAFLEAVNPGHLRRRSTCGTPDIKRRVRRTQGNF